MTQSQDKDDLELAHDLNLTPFIDVMLVLLIIFMVAAPLATIEVPVDLPATRASPHHVDETALHLDIDADGHWRLERQPLPPEQLQAQLEQRSGGNHQRQILLRGDRHLHYQQLMDAMSALDAAGYTHLALVGQADEALE